MNSSVAYYDIVSGDQISIKMQRRRSTRVADGAPKQSTSDMEPPSKKQRSKRDEPQNGRHAKLGTYNIDQEQTNLLLSGQLLLQRCFLIKMVMRQTQ